MANATDTEVIIGGKVFTLSGNESEEYLQKVASYINNKLAEFSRTESYKRTPQDMQSILLALNIADDYFKAMKKISLLEEQLEGKERDLYNIKHELITAQIKLENNEKNVKNLETKVSESNNKVKRLEAELRNHN